MLVLETDRHQIVEREDVLECLRRAAAAHVTCTVRASGRPESYISRLRSLDESSADLCFDAPRAPVIDRAMGPGAMATVEFKLDEIRVSFEAPVRRIAPGNGGVFLHLGIPSTIEQPQRRDSFRVTVPGHLAVRMTIDRGAPLLRELPVENLSIGGASLSATASLEHFEPGRVFEGGELIMPDDRVYALTLRVRHASARRLVGQVGQLSIGLQFLRRPGGLEQVLAALIDEIAREFGKPPRP
jgi:c-di-GMP-binding flagellar brake protein YcgR